MRSMCRGQAYTVEEVKERQAELSKMRALMFYHERKQHHMNKIKSKVGRHACATSFCAFV